MGGDMPQRNDREKNRLKSARLKNLSLLPKSNTLRKPSDPEQAKEWLLDVADHLSNLANARPHFRFVAYALKRFLRDSDNRDLSKELKLVYPQGTPGTFHIRTTKLDRARAIHKLRLAGTSWKNVADELKIDAGSLRKIYREFLPRFKKEEQLAPLDQAVREVLRER